ncbi:M48 family metalloprotease [Candidatus Omnitrophota bacterium]
MSQKIENQLQVSKDTKMQNRVQKIGERLAAVCGRKDISYSFTVIEEDSANAFALPGGYVYVFDELIEKTETDDEISAILAHEIAHIVARHSIKRLQASLGYQIVSILALVASKDPRFKRGSDLAFDQIMRGYSRDDELLADKLSVRYLRKAGFNPEAVLGLLNKLKQFEKEGPRMPLVPNYVRTHPYLPERIAAVKQELYGKLDFDDYLNRMDEE